MKSLVSVKYVNYYERLGVIEKVNILKVNLKVISSM